MILHLYFARRFALIFALIFLVLAVLVGLIDLIDQTRRFSDQELSFGERIGLTVLNLPKTMNEALPIVMVLATIALFIGLARTSELVVTRASGRSALRALIAPVVVSLIIGGIAVSMFGPIVAATSKRYAALSESYRSGGVSTFAVSEDGLWLREGAPRWQRVIRASRSNADASVLYDVTFISYRDTSGPTRRIDAASAALVDQTWQLRDAKAWPLVTGLNPEASAAEHDLLELPSTLTLERIRETIGTPAGVSIWDMPTFIAQLEQAGFSARRHQVWLQSELARPVFLVGMLLIGAAFTMRHTRFGGTGTAVLATLMLGFGLYFIRSFAQILGENGQIPILLAAWAAPVASILLALGLLLRSEDG